MHSPFWSVDPWKVFGKDNLQMNRSSHEVASYHVCGNFSRTIILQISRQPYYLWNFILQFFLYQDKERINFFPKSPSTRYKTFKDYYICGNCEREVWTHLARYITHGLPKPSNFSPIKLCYYRTHCTQEIFGRGKFWQIMQVKAIGEEKFVE